MIRADQRILPHASRDLARARRFNAKGECASRRRNAFLRNSPPAAPNSRFRIPELPRTADSAHTLYRLALLLLALHALPVAATPGIWNTSPPTAEATGSAGIFGTTTSALCLRRTLSCRYYHREPACQREENEVAGESGQPRLRRSNDPPKHTYLLPFSRSPNHQCKARWPGNRSAI